MFLMYICTFQEFQRELVKAGETFAAIGYRHIEAGEISIYTLCNCNVLHKGI